MDRTGSSDKIIKEQKTIYSNRVLIDELLVKANIVILNDNRPAYGGYTGGTNLVHQNLDYSDAVKIYS